MDNTHLNTPVAEPMPFYKGKWFIVIVLTLAILLIATALFASLTPEIPVEKSNTWNGLTPGVSSANDVVKKFGEPIRSVETDQGTTLEYTSNFPAIPNQVVVSDQGQVSFMKELFTYNVNHTLAQYVDQFGETDFSIRAPNLSEAGMAHVFLDEGLVIVVHQADNTVQEKWYFVPTTKENFMAAWGAELEEEDRPEPAFR